MLSHVRSHQNRSKPGNTLNSKYETDKYPIGAGAFGKVYQGQSKSTGGKVVIKEMLSSPTDLLDTTILIRELTLLKLLKNHPNIISLEDAIIFSTKEGLNIYLVFEACDLDLSYVIRWKRDQLTPRHIQYIVYQILHGIHYAHSANVIHRDMKPANVLINCEDLVVKICDFGASRVTQVTCEIQHPENGTSFLSFDNLTEYVTTRWYRGPEVIIKPYGKPADIWSVGCILAEMILGAPLFPGCTDVGMLFLIHTLIKTFEPYDCSWINHEEGRQLLVNISSNSAGPTFQEKFFGKDRATVQFLKELLEFNPNKRLTAEQALKHPFFNSVHQKQEIVGFPFAPLSAETQDTVKAYYQYEAAVGHSLDISLTEGMLVQRGQELIQQEVNRYNPQMNVKKSMNQISSTLAALSIFERHQENNEKAGEITSDMTADSACEKKTNTYQALSPQNHNT